MEEPFAKSRVMEQREMLTSVCRMLVFVSCPEFQGKYTVPLIGAPAQYVCSCSTQTAPLLGLQQSEGRVG